MTKRKKISIMLAANRGVSSIVLLLAIVIFAFFLSSVFFASIPTDNPVIALWQNTPPGKSYSTLELQTMRFITATPTPTPEPDTQTTTTTTTSSFSSGVHGAFNIYTPAEVVEAHNAGVTYDLIDYWGNHGASALTWDVDANSALGKALLQYNMKGYLMLSDLLSKNPDGTMVVDTATVTSRVKAYANSPLLAGYWIKDDDPQLCGDGSYNAPMFSQLQAEYKLIRQLDPNTSHVIMAGFCDSADLNKNYHPSPGAPIADALGMYPYPNLYKGWTFFTDETTEVQKEASIVQQNTPAGVPQPAMIGIYAGFWGDNCYLGIYHCNGGVAPISQTELITDVDAFMNNGFAGVADFSFEATDVNHTAGTDPGMLQYVQDVTNELKRLGKY